MSDVGQQLERETERERQTDRETETLPPHLLRVCESLIGCGHLFEGLLCHLLLLWRVAVWVVLEGQLAVAAREKGREKGE